MDKIYQSSRRHGVKIRIDETGEVFESIQDCAEALDANVSWVGKVSRRDRGLCTCRGLHLTRVNDPEPMDISDRRGRPKISVRIVETGEEFKSIKECANYINGSPGTISEILYGDRGRTTHKGFHFELIE